MIKQFAGASIWSADLNNLLPFYRDVLGLNVSMESPRFVVLATDRPDAPGLALGSHDKVHGSNMDPARHMVSLLSDDVRGDWERLKKEGVDFIEEPTEYGDMVIATLKDPEGNYVQLLQPAAG